jgi:hypothetical protein
MRGAIAPFSQYAFMAWCSVKTAQGQPYLYLYLCLLYLKERDLLEDLVLDGTVMLK